MLTEVSTKEKKDLGKIWEDLGEPLVPDARTLFPALIAIFSVPLVSDLPLPGKPTPDPMTAPVLCQAFGVGPLMPLSRELSAPEFIFSRKLSTHISYSSSNTSLDLGGLSGPHTYFPALLGG